MSRRSRRRKGVRSEGANWLGKSLIALIALGLLGAGLLYAAVRSYLHSDGFRRFLSEKASVVAGVDGEFTPFRWDGLAVDTASFEGTGEGMIREIRLEGLHTEVGVGGLRRGVWEISGSRMQRLEVTLDARDQGALARPSELTPPPTPPAAKSPGWLPNKVDLRGLDVRNVVIRATVDAGLAEASGMRVAIEPDGAPGAYRLEIADGSLRLPFEILPEIRLGRAKLRYQNGRVYLNSADATLWDEGRLEAAGEWDSAARQFSLYGNLTGVKCEDLFNETWDKRLSGTLESDFAVDNRAGYAAANGKLELRNGTLTALPVLDALAAYADTRRFRVLALNEAHTAWRWKKGEFQLTDLVLSSEGLVRLEGALNIRGRMIDGVFRLGIAPGTLSTIPGAETHVFLPGERGLLWAPLHITGTLDDPQEDLTARLIEAAGLRMFEVIPETGEKVIRFSQTMMNESHIETLNKAIQEGTNIIDTGTGIIDNAGGLIDGLLGTGTPPKDIPPKTIKENPTEHVEDKAEKPLDKNPEKTVDESIEEAIRNPIKKTVGEKSQKPADGKTEGGLKKKVEEKAEDTVDESIEKALKETIKIPGGGIPGGLPVGP